MLSSDSPLCTSINPSLFHSRLKTYLFHKSYPLPRSFTSSSRTASTDFCLDRFFWATRFLILFFLIFFRFWSVRLIKLAIPSAFVRTLIYRIVSYRTISFDSGQNWNAYIIIISPPDIEMPTGLGLCLADVTFFIFNDPTGGQLSQKVLYRSSQNFQDRYTCGWAWSFRLSFPDRSRDVAMVTNFLANRRQLVETISFGSLSSHKRWQDRNRDARVKIAEDPSTYGKNLLKCGPVTPEFCLPVCAQVELHAALFSAFRFNYIRQMAPLIVDADAKSSVSVGESARRAGSRWALPRV